MFSELQSYIEMQVGGSEFHPFIFILLVVGGFLASLLPCVYPLYPITAGILKTRTSSVKWLHPIVYYFGLAFMYLLFGVIAGITGGVFNAILRYPETNFLLSYILFILALSSAELIHLPFFGQRSANTGSASLSGSFILGMAAGLLSSPCVGPVVVSILLQVISTSDGAFSFFPILATSIKMFAFGLGVGLPFLAVGVFGLSLPRSGKWMRYVQYALSLLIFYFSYNYFEKASDSLGWSDGTTLKIYLISVLILIASYLYQDHSDFISIRMKKAISLASLFLLAAILSSAILNTNSSSPNISDIKVESEVSGNLTWFRSKEIVFKKAKLEGKAIFIDFYADWCTNCKEFQKLTLKNQNLNSVLKEKVILWKVKDTDEIFDVFVEDQRFPELKIGLPFFVILDEKENLIYKTNNYLATDEMMDTIRSISR